MSTIRLRPQDAETLEKLRARLILQGKKLTKQELLGLLIERAANQDIHAFLSSEEPDSENDPALTLLDEAPDWGIDDASERVDEFLYGNSSKNEGNGDPH